MYRVYIQYIEIFIKRCIKEIIFKIYLYILYNILTFMIKCNFYI